MAEKDVVLEVGALPHNRGADFVSIYSNSAKISVGFYDLNILFCQVLPEPEGGAVLQERAIVSMSLEHAKALMNALRGPIEEYEKLNGSIRISPVKRPVAAPADAPPKAQSG